MATETFNFPMVDIGYFLQMLENQFTAEREDLQFDMQGKPIMDPLTGKQKHRVPAPMLALGKAGIGKTEGIRGVAEKLGVGFKEMRLVNYMETDLIGIPFKNEYGMTDHATNVLFPRPEYLGGKDPEEGILLVDEFTSAQDSIQVPILQLTDSSRSVGNYHLPDGWKIVIAGNGPDDGGTFRSLPGTVISRAACFYVVTDTGSWLEWAGTHGIHYTIRAFIKKSNQSLHGYKEDDDGGYDRAFPCPRSWARLSTSLYDWDKTYSKPHWTTEAFANQHGDTFLTNWVASYVGVETARDFVQFTKNADKIIAAEDIMNGTAKQRFDATFTRDAGACYLTITRLADGLREASKEAMSNILNLTSSKFFKQVINSMKWITESNAPMDNQVFAISDISAAIPGIAASIWQDPEFNKQCPNFAKIRAVNTLVHNLG